MDRIFISSLQLEDSQVSNIHAPPSASESEFSIVEEAVLHVHVMHVFRNFSEEWVSKRL
jgi:hypothetical protein